MGVMSVNLPIDLILEILSRLPSKSIARCRCVSKLWASLLTLGSPYFTDLFSIQSITRPRLLFAIKNEDHDWYLYSSPQPQISYQKSVTVEFHMSTPKTMFLHSITSFSGLVYLPNTPGYNRPMLYNPITRHSFSVPNLTRAAVYSYLGYNPINKHFSVLAICSPSPSDRVLPSSYQILNLESGKLFWRTLDCPLHHDPVDASVNINGILYYLGSIWRDEDDLKIVCFDLNSEEFKFIDSPCPDGAYLVNFKGKLGGINIKWVKPGTDKEGMGLNQLELCLHVLKDVEREEWSKHVYLLPLSFLWYRTPSYRVAGLTGTSDLVFSEMDITHPFYVYFFNLEKKIFRRIDIKGLETFKPRSPIQICVDYVEDLKALNWS